MAFLVSSAIIYAQTGDVSGIVAEEGNRLPLAGANIFVENTETGTAADLSGLLKLKSNKPVNSPAFFSSIYSRWQKAIMNPRIAANTKG